ncbi:nucleotidyl transferase [candidate division KSB1 bacterium]|nr:nucleotidyl transferase [candidate division KSB1 bacterium]
MIKKAVITAAGKGTRQYPATNSVQKELFPLVDRDGITKPIIQIIAEEAIQTGIEEICIIVQPGAAKIFQNHFVGLNYEEKTAFHNKEWAIEQSRLLEKLQGCITYLEQKEPKGYGHAVYCAREFVGNEPFLLLLGDHVYISDTSQSCIIQLLQNYEKFQSTIYGVQKTPASQLHLYGTVAGEPIIDIPNAYRLTKVVEKPEITYAQKKFRISNLPQDIFLTLFGIQIMTPAIFEILEKQIQHPASSTGEIEMAPAQSELCERETVIGLEIDGERLEIGTPLGYLETQISLAMNGVFAHDLTKYFKSKRGWSEQNGN